jgi:tetratricopeptide (TPR) repeat protein
MLTRTSRFAFPVSLVALVALGLAAAHAADTIRQREPDGKLKPRLGKIKEVTSQHVVLQLTPSDRTEKIEANVIDSISYDGQPADMTLLPAQVRGGNFTNANAMIRKLSDVEIANPGVKEELAFYKVYVEVKVAMASGSVVEMKKAKDALAGYLKTSLNSWHYYEAVELLGDVCLAVAAVEVENAKPGWYQLAIDQSFTRLRQAPWPETQIRAWMSQAKVLHLNKNVDGALSAYDEALKLTDAKNADAQMASLALAAKVGKAEVLGDKTPAEGIKLIQEIIGKADEEDSRVQGVSALAIARCYEKAGNPKEALLNYLKVDVLYFQQPKLHEEALYNLYRLWAGPPFNNAQRSAEAATRLRELYPGSAWTAKLGGG